MKRSILKAVLFCSLTATCFLGTACSNNDKSQINDQSQDSNQSKQVSVVSGSEQQEKAANAQNSSEQISQNTSSENVSENVVSENQAASDAETSSSDTSAERSGELSDEVSDESSDSSADNEASLPEQYDGYYFDDEQIVKDYHTAKEFTGDEKFNALFKENSIDKEFQKEIMETENESDMRAVTIKYGKRWKEEAGNAYDKLLELLESIPEEKQKLIESQNEWESTLDETESSFKNEAGDENIMGTQALLASDSAMLNYYKGRAAVLYQQIYSITGSFEL